MAKVIITGATGTAGSAIISHVTVLGRRAPPGVSSDKLTTIILPSDEYGAFDGMKPALVERLRGYDAVIWAMGAMQTQIKGEEYVRAVELARQLGSDGSITPDFTLEGARAFAQLGTPDKPFRFVFMTGMGTSQSAKDGWFTPPYVKVKGETEVALKASETESFKAAFVRPGGILATEEHRPNLIWYNRIILDVLSYAWPSGMIKSTDLADACIQLATGKGWEKRDAKEHAIENADLKRLAEAYRDTLAP